MLGDSGRESSSTRIDLGEEVWSVGVLESRIVRRLCIEDVGMESSLTVPKHFVGTVGGRDVVWGR